MPPSAMPSIGPNCWISVCSFWFDITTEPCISVPSAVNSALSKNFTACLVCALIMLAAWVASSAFSNRTCMSIVRPSVTLSEPYAAVALTGSLSSTLPLARPHSESLVFTFLYISTNGVELFSVAVPATSALTPAALPRPPPNATTSVELSANVSAPVSPVLSLIRMTSPSFVISPPSLVMSSLDFSMQSSALALSMPWPTMTTDGLLVRSLAPNATDVTDVIGSQLQRVLNWLIFCCTSPVDSFGSTNCFHSWLCWTCERLTPNTTSESAGSSDMSSAAPPDASPDLSPVGELDPSFLQPAARTVLPSASAMTSQAWRVRTIGNLL